MTWEQQLGDYGRTIDASIVTEQAIQLRLTNDYIGLKSENLRLNTELTAAKTEISRLLVIINQTPSPVDPPPVVVPPTGGKLRFKAPGLITPVVIDMNLGATIPATMDDTKDYEIILPSDRAFTRNGTGLDLNGGRNIRIIGGSVVVAGASGVCRAAYIRNNKGIVHLEGVRFKSLFGVFTEGINMSCPDATVQIQNCWVDGICTGTQATNHADIIQTWNGPKTLRVDGLKGRTNYQAAFLNPRDTNPASQPIEGTFEMHRCDFESVNGAYTLWLVPPPALVKTSKVHCWGPSKGEWKPEMWPGIIHTKPTEDFTGGAGLSYNSPGYL